jgi:hypothetical protein
LNRRDRDHAPFLFLFLEARNSRGRTVPSLNLWSEQCTESRAIEFPLHARLTLRLELTFPLPLVVVTAVCNYRPGIHRDCCTLSQINKWTTKLLTLRDPPPQSFKTLPGSCKFVKHELLTFDTSKPLFKLTVQKVILLSSCFIITQTVIRDPWHTTYLSGIFVDNAHCSRNDSTNVFNQFRNFFGLFVK